ncbi:MAG: sensor histidine kinase [Fodinibius sp.]|nr:sensor histidine kinase [Fodinibius sp.]
MPTEEYIRELVQTIRNTFAEGKDIAITVDINSSIIMNINQTIPLGMLLNELVTNSMKYAFQDMDGGEISITVEQEQEEFVIEYRDNGKGFKREEFEKHAHPWVHDHTDVA